MNLIGLIRLGRDAELRYTGDGTPVLELAAAWNYGRKGDDGKRPTQWASLSIWGQRAESLEQHLKKGQQLYVVCSDVHVRTYQKRDGGEGFALSGTVQDLEFAGSRQEGGAPTAAPAARAPAPAPARAPAPAPKPASTGSGFDDMDDDIPF